jgi:hypothetical protein
MECPYCGAELNCIDYYGFYLGHDQWDKQGDIYECENEECESGLFNYHFHTDLQGNLHEGYPC